MSDSIASVAKSKVRPSRRSRWPLLVLILFLGVLGWEYWGFRNQQQSLSALQSELLRRRMSDQPLTRDEIGKLISGAPHHQSESSGLQQADYYSWRGLFTASHIVVTSDMSNRVLHAENSPLGPIARTSARDVPAIPPRTPRPPSPETLARVQAALAKAEQIYIEAGTGTDEFMQVLRSVAQDLPELEVSTLKNQLKWNQFKLPRGKQRLFAFQYTLPPQQHVETYMVSWMNMNNGSGIFAFKDIASAASTVYGRWWDQAVNIKIDGIDLPNRNLVRFRWIPAQFNGGIKQYIHWFMTFDDNLETDFEFKTLLYAGQPETQVSRPGADQIIDYLGLKTSLRRAEPTAEGARDGLQAVDDRLIHESDPGEIPMARILRPLVAQFEELPSHSDPSQIAWHPVKFPIGQTSAMRVRIPKSLGPKVDLYGAVVSSSEIKIGWDKAGPTYNALQTRQFPDTTIANSPDASLSHLLLFSRHEGNLQGGTEFVLWIHRTRPGNDPVFVTLNLASHDPINDSYDFVSASRPVSCARRLGITLPPLPTPEGSVVLGQHDLRMTRASFTADSKRLISVDALGHIQVWSVDPPQLERRIDMPFTAAALTAIDPGGREICAYEQGDERLLRWSLATGEQLPTIDVYSKNNAGIRGMGFGPELGQLFVVQRANGTLAEHEHRFGIYNLVEPGVPVFSKDVRESTRSNYYSLTCLPDLQLCAVGRTRDNGSGSVLACCEIWPLDFSAPIRELPLGELSITGRGYHEQNRVRLSVQPDGRRLAGICESGELKVWDVGTWTELLHQHIEPRRNPDPKQFQHSVGMPLIDVSLSADGKSVAVAEKFHPAVSVWTVSDARIQERWAADQSPIALVAHSPDGRWVATASEEGVVRLWKNQ